MELQLRLFATFREIVGGKEHTLTVDEGASVGDVLATLEAEYDELEERLLEDGTLRPQLSVLKNGRDVIHQEGAATPLEDGDTLSVFPPVAGG
ncbi:ubiquitin-like small modifier protein 1 [Natrarchaeobaculum aegyptiacum]|uniref:Molybdopterin synthase sulfur carrier subunit n=1 Tax=Natrarchaeobaculum aegyptiacum TaxID=745377 RepID=A0A2Z2HR10_9EURY|nr:ubiquitin-like small modifier protein 1 [Natrarchaeobaculum aegyptiacum]ARS89489.1 molybdopterin synthase sulfur carrier subunit [Natrarchaeobaculum aegyptiacum]